MNNKSYKGILVAGIVLSLVLTGQVLLANPNFEGGGSGDWQFGSFTNDPFQPQWIGLMTVDTFYGRFIEVDGYDTTILGYFWNTYHQTNMDGTIDWIGIWAIATTAGDGTWEFTVDEDTINGTWTAVRGTGSGTIWGRSIQ